MALVSRLAGAVLVEDRERIFLVGDLKRPCDWKAAGFEPPEIVDPLEFRFLELFSSEGRQQLAGLERGPSHRSPWLEILAHGECCEQLCDELFKRLLIERNGSVSERIWNLILDNLDEEEKQPLLVDWVLTTPFGIWSILRESLLRCV